jgi:hypoxanthine phosphoribosyltransferase
MTRPTSPPAPELLISAERLGQRLEELAAAINRDYRDTRRLVCIGVLKGAVFFMTDLIKRLEVPVAVDFFQVSSYRGATTPGELRVRKDIDLPVRGEDVLLVEDIIDTGYTLRTILDMFRFRGARTVRLCVLLDKRERREVEVTVDYCGFEIEDRFVVGYGLDFDELYRNLPYVGYLAPPASEGSATSP